MSLYSACDKNPDPGKDDFGPDPSWGIMHRLSLMSWHLFAAVCKNIRIYHECEGRVETFVPRIAIWHHEACRMMTNGDPEGRIFLSHTHMKNELFFLLTTVFIYLF